MQQLSGAGIVLGKGISCDLQYGETALCTIGLVVNDAPSFILPLPEFTC